MNMSYKCKVNKVDKDGNKNDQLEDVLVTGKSGIGGISHNDAYQRNECMIDYPEEYLPSIQQVPHNTEDPTPTFP